MTLDPQSLTPVEQYVYTNGACQVFLAAALQVVGGRPTLMSTTDPRLLAKHDYPEGESLDLHVYLTLDNGMVVDAEGVRSQAELEHAFGVGSRSKKQISVDVDPSCMGAPNPTLVEKLAVRLRDLGWAPGRAPAWNKALQAEKDLDGLDAEARSWWPLWEKLAELPHGAQPGLKRLWLMADFPTGRDLGLGENPMHAWSHLPDMIAMRLKKRPEQRNTLGTMLGHGRYLDMKTPLHLLGDELMEKDASWMLATGSRLLLDEILEHRLDDALMARNQSGTMACEALHEGMIRFPGEYTETLRLRLTSMIEFEHMRNQTSKAVGGRTPSMRL